MPRSVQDPLSSSEVNVTGTLNVLLAARDADVRRVVYASSSSVYGAATADAIKREDLPVAPLSPYGVAKFAGEAYCSSFHAVYGLETVSLRYFNVFGPRQSPISEYAAVIPNFFAAALLDERPTIYGDGEQSRDFTYVDNVVAANLVAAHAVGAAGETFNIACGDSTTINELLRTVSAVSGRALEPVYAPGRARRRAEVAGGHQQGAASARLRAERAARRRACAPASSTSAVTSRYFRRSASGAAGSRWRADRSVARLRSPGRLKRSGRVLLRRPGSAAWRQGQMVAASLELLRRDREQDPRKRGKAHDFEPAAEDRHLQQNEEADGGSERQGRKRVVLDASAHGRYRHRRAI